LARLTDAADNDKRQLGEKYLVLLRHVIMNKS